MEERRGNGSFTFNTTIPLISLESTGATLVWNMSKFRMGIKILKKLNKYLCL
jgi:hypothetical protein